MRIIPDLWHTFLLTLPFIVAVFGLYAIIWQPLTEWMDERRGLESKARKEAEELDDAAHDQLARIESRLADARRDAADVRGAARERALSKEGEILDAARTKADKRVDEEIQRLETEREAAQHALKETAQSLSQAIAARVLGRELS